LEYKEGTKEYAGKSDLAYVYDLLKENPFLRNHQDPDRIG
jgi:hypothetical protein